MMKSTRRYAVSVGQEACRSGRLVRLPGASSGRPTT